MIPNLKLTKRIHILNNYQLEEFMTNNSIYGDNNFIKEFKNLNCLQIWRTDIYDFETLISSSNLNTLEFISWMEI